MGENFFLFIINRRCQAYNALCYGQVQNPKQLWGFNIKRTLLYLTEVQRGISDFLFDQNKNYQYLDSHLDTAAAAVIFRQ